MAFRAELTNYIVPRNRLYSNYLLQRSLREALSKSNSKGPAIGLNPVKIAVACGLTAVLWVGRPNQMIGFIRLKC